MQRPLLYPTAPLASQTRHARLCVPQRQRLISRAASNGWASREAQGAAPVDYLSMAVLPTRQQPTRQNKTEGLSAQSADQTSQERDPQTVKVRAKVEVIYAHLLPAEVETRGRRFLRLDFIVTFTVINLAIYGPLTHAHVSLYMIESAFARILSRITQSMLKRRRLRKLDTFGSLRGCCRQLCSQRYRSRRCMVLD